ADLTFVLNDSDTSTTGIFSNVGPGPANIKVFDQWGCLVEVDTVVASTPAPVIDDVQTQDSDCDLSSGALEVLASNGTGTITYSIDGINYTTNSIFSGLSPGPYTVYIQDGTSCGDTTIVEIDSPAPDNIAVDTTFCEGDFIVIGGDTIASDGPHQVLLPGAAGECDTLVDVTVTLVNCCTPGVLTEQETLCFGDSIIWNGLVLKETGMYQDTLDDAAANGCDSIEILDLFVWPENITLLDTSICEGEILDFNGMMLSDSGTYSMTFAGGNGCDSIVELALAIEALPAADAGADQTISCQATAVQIGGSNSGLQILWTGPGIDATNQNDPTPMVSVPGEYILQVTNAAGCVALDTVDVMSDPNVPVANAGPDGVLSCDIDQVQLNGMATGNNLEYTWTGPGINPGNEHDPDPIVDTAGIYVLIATDTIANCISAADTVVVDDITNTIDAQIAPAGNLDCEVVQLTLDASGGSAGPNIIFTWTNSGGQILGTADTLDVSSAGTYFFEARDTVSGCSGMAEITVADLSSLPPANAGDDALLTCDIIETELSGINGDPNLVFMWSGPAGGILTDSTQLSVTVGTGGWYFLTVLDTTNGCTNIDSAYVDTDTLAPVAEAGPDQALTCIDQTITIDATGSSTGAGIVYSWDGPSISGDPNFSIMVQDAGWYFLTVIDQGNGCSALDSVLVDTTNFLSGAVIDPRDPVCFGDNTGRITITEVIGGQAPYAFTLISASEMKVQDTGDFGDLEAGDYTIIVTDANGCEWMTDVTLNEGPMISLDIGPDDIYIKIGEEYQLESVITPGPGLIDSIVWTPSDILSCDHCFDPILTGITSGTVQATIYLGNTCQDTDVLAFRVDRRADVWVPNVFSPNGDDINDLVTVYAGPGITSVLEFEIFDRWGEKVFGRYDFPPNQIELGWDGMFKGELMQPAVFVYLVKVQMLDGSIVPISGDITLIR
ncbi:MAG: gliding motility-associated C-terminal domain-containing protein, partial [Saprospiraceae bacterium]|nr:gliding motility-associated C-terminal domain-containing protein [Saprospiraceae bacterium]